MNTVFIYQIIGKHLGCLLQPKYTALCTILFCMKFVQLLTYGDCVEYLGFSGSNATIALPAFIDPVKDNSDR